MDVHETDRNRNYSLIMRVGMVGAAFLSVFGINALFNAAYLVASVLLAITVLTIASMMAMRVTGNHIYGANGISAAVVITYTFLLASGGIDNTGPLWCYPLTVSVMLLQGFKRGVAIVLGLLAITLLVMYYPDLPFVITEYPPNFRIRFIGSFSALTITSFIYEYLRWKSNEDYIAISQDLDRASRTDALTGVANRRDMQERLETEYATFKRHGHAFSIIMADLDHFKHINDRYGHALGDQLLISVSQLFSKGVRRQDLVARWGGEEFLILLPQTKFDQAMVVAEKLRTTVFDMDLSESKVDQPISASFGVQCICRVDNLPDLIVEADRMLYEAKRRGRNKVVGIIELPQADNTTILSSGPCGR
ncbi:MAG: GGDEF domain-containing protein [Chromatiales bacterium]|nr:GGDEF domain-containing protein [Chromatiales bacterium]